MPRLFSNAKEALKSNPGPVSIRDSDRTARLVSFEINDESSPYSTEEKATESNPRSVTIRPSEKTVRLVSSEISEVNEDETRQTSNRNGVQRMAKNQADDLLGKLSLPRSNKSFELPNSLPPYIEERENQGEHFNLGNRTFVLSTAERRCILTHAEYKQLLENRLYSGVPTKGVDNWRPLSINPMENGLFTGVPTKGVDNWRPPSINPQPLSSQSTKSLVTNLFVLSSIFKS